jgi:hypothetical protein
MKSKKLAVIVPYRDRESHLEQFMPRMKEFLESNNITFHITVIEQANKLPFNRAKLLNVGFNECQFYDYFCFHDVDMLPIEADYSFPDSPTHLAANVEQFGWGLAYETYFGGVTLFSKEDFLKINGYSNNYNGWGAEDDDLWNRCIQNKLFPKRRPGKYSSLHHERIVDQVQWRKNYDYLRFQDDPIVRDQVMKIDGLSSLSYTVNSIEDLNEFTSKIKVTI